MPSPRRRKPHLGRRATGAAITLAGVAGAVLVLLPFRSSIDVGTAALVLVVPVAVGVAVGGFPVAPVGVITGFLAFDFFFIPPYETFRVGAWEHWLSVGVYSAVGLIVGGVVAQLQKARDVAKERESEVRILYELADSVAGAEGLDGALRAVARLAGQLFALQTVAVLLTEPDGGLRVAAAEGEPLLETEVRQLVRRQAVSRADRAATYSATEFLPVSGAPGLLVGGLATVSGPVGVLVVRMSAPGPESLRLLALFAAQAGSAVERAQLAEQAARSRNLAEVDRLRSSLIGAVSHDLRTPLASIKASVSDLADPEVGLTDDDRCVLLATIEQETDRLSRFVANLLDMSRIESGGLRLERSATPIEELIEQVLVRFGPLFSGPVSVQVPEDLPLVDIDYLLIEQVMANLLENAIRHCPVGTALEIGAGAVGSWVEVRVSDDGPGIRAEERQRIFDLFYRTEGRGGGGTGMGLAICEGIIEAHGGRMWVEQRREGGSAFVFRLPASTAPIAPGDLEIADAQEARK